MEETAYGLFQRGAALLSEGMVREAAESLERAREMEPDKASIREALARAYYAQGRTTDARAEFSAAACIDPSNDYAHFGLALCLERENRLDEARGHARLAVAMKPENEDYRRALDRIERSGAS
ncbi:MAG TPA: tetratricopeptide repeat protein [Actinomycetota bacterium]|nr:tetratricopeptide repeat protein [Actinomycetota bacterium]